MVEPQQPEPVEPPPPVVAGGVELDPPPGQSDHATLSDGTRALILDPDALPRRASAQGPSGWAVGTALLGQATDGLRAVLAAVLRALGRLSRS
jgi:hypothetical protein